MYIHTCVCVVKCHIIREKPPTFLYQLYSIFIPCQLREISLLSMLDDQGSRLTHFFFLPVNQVSWALNLMFSVCLTFFVIKNLATTNEKNLKFGIQLQHGVYKLLNFLFDGCGGNCVPCDTFHLLHTCFILIL